MEETRAIYNTYSSDESITVSKKSLYADTDGFPNELAFRDFCSHLEEKDDFRLVCVNFDLSASNTTKGYAYGTFVLRKLFMELQENFYMFRVSGDKFNVVAKKEQIEGLLNLFNSYPADFTVVYYGVVDDIALTKDNYSILRKLGKEFMYKHKAFKTKKKISEVNDEVIVGNKGNVPAELQETATRKYRETMWYAEILLEETEPSPRKVTAHVYITEYKKYPALLNMVVVMEDMKTSKALCGNLVTAGFNSNRFDLNARIDDDGRLIIQCFPHRTNRGKVTMSIQTYEGNYIPISFGKRIDKYRELFPIKPNIYGSYEYVLWDRKHKTAEIVDTGIIELDGVKHSVRFDSKGIDLIPTETNYNEENDEEEGITI